MSAYHTAASVLPRGCPGEGVLSRTRSRKNVAGNFRYGRMAPLRTVEDRTALPPGTVLSDSQAQP